MCIASFKLCLARSFECVILKHDKNKKCLNKNPKRRIFKKIWELRDMRLSKITKTCNLIFNLKLPCGVCVYAHKTSLELLCLIFVNLHYFQPCLLTGSALLHCLFLAHCYISSHITAANCSAAGMPVWLRAPLRMCVCVLMHNKQKRPTYKNIAP